LYVSGHEYMPTLEALCKDSYLSIRELVPVPDDFIGFNQVGKPITDAEAQAWVQQVRGFNTNYQVFVKHWLESQMPPTYRDGLVFINDSQGFRSLSAMITDFAAWGQHFSPAPVGFQFGYARDRKWWSRLSDPPKDIGQAILAQTPNTMDLYWVDFTAYDIWPPE